MLIGRQIHKQISETVADSTRLTLLRFWQWHNADWRVWRSSFNCSTKAHRRRWRLLLPAISKLAQSLYVKKGKRQTTFLSILSALPRHTLLTWWAIVAVKRSLKTSKLTSLCMHKADCHHALLQRTNLVLDDKSKSRGGSLWHLWHLPEPWGSDCSNQWRESLHTTSTF